MWRMVIDDSELVLYEQRLRRLLNPQLALERGMRRYLDSIEGTITKYAPVSRANIPPGINGRWYVRGIGTRTITGRTYHTSEQMNRKWLFGVTAGAASVIGSIRNLASYSGYVVGDFQTKLHKSRGWVNVDKTIDETEARLGELTEDELIAEFER